MLRLRISLVFLTLAVAACGCTAQTITLGALEELHGNYTGEPNFYGVRVLFEKARGAWRPYPATCEPYGCLEGLPAKYPPEMKWSISFDGRKVGQVIGETPKRFDFYSHVGLQKIVSKGTVPTVGAKSHEFGGYAGAEVHRPLVANSQPYYKDPESWRVAQLSLERTTVLRNQFQKKFPKLCRNADEDHKKPLEVFPYKNDQVNIVKAYTSRKGWIVARLELANAIECDDTEAGFGLSEQWFVVEPRNTVWYLGTDMWLVDAGDYDNDGKSEVLFAVAGDNRGGYRLFYDDFKEQAVFEYSYH